MGKTGVMVLSPENKSEQAAIARHAQPFAPYIRNMIRRDHQLLKKINKMGIDVFIHDSSVILSFELPSDWKVVHLGKAVEAFKENYPYKSDLSPLIKLGAKGASIKFETYMIDISASTKLEDTASELAKIKLYFEGMLHIIDHAQEDYDRSGIPKPPPILRGERTIY